MGSSILYLKELSTVWNWNVSRGYGAEGLVLNTHTHSHTNIYIYILFKLFNKGNYRPGCSDSIPSLFLFAFCQLPEQRSAYVTTMIGEWCMIKV